MAAYWEKAAHSAYDMFSRYKFPPRFLEWEFLSDCAFPDHCLLVPFVFVHTLLGTSNATFTFSFLSQKVINLFNQNLHLIKWQFRLLTLCKFQNNWSMKKYKNMVYSTRLKNKKVTKKPTQQLSCNLWGIPGFI